MLARALLVLVSTAQLAGCMAGLPTPASLRPTASLAAAARADAGLQATLARFSQEEGRRVTTRNVPMSDGRGAAELRVPLTPAERTMLVQLYRLHPRAVPASEFPQGLIARTKAHLRTLHGYKLPASPRLDPAVLAGEMRTRVYRDGDGKTLAYESFLVGENFQLFGKYDLEGRILQVDLETF